MKNSYYFSHDSNARNDEKILMLRADHGWTGYGIFWALIETMFESEETCIKHDRIKGIALGFNMDITLLESIIYTCIEENLFESDGDTFWSNSLRRRKAKFLELKEKRSKAGKKGAEARWDNVNNNNEKEEDNGNAIANAWQTHGNVIAKDGKGKERKEKKNKLNKLNNTLAKKDYGEGGFVSLTNDEYQKLIDKHGEEATKQMIEMLDNYKGSTGKKYKSDYHAILSWVVKRYQEDQGKGFYKPKEPRTFWDNDYTGKGQLPKEEISPPYHREYKPQTPNDTQKGQEEKEVIIPDFDKLIDETLEKMSKPKNKKGDVK